MISTAAVFFVVLGAVATAIEMREKWLERKRKEDSRKRLLEYRSGMDWR